MRIAASSARRFNSALSGVNRKNSRRRLLISSSPVLFAPVKQSGTEATLPVARSTIIYPVGVRGYGGGSASRFSASFLIKFETYELG
jgi:hypothetical protein